MRIVAPPALALTLAAGAAGCFSVRATAGVGASRAGPSLELGLTIGVGGERSITALDTGLGLGGKRGATAVATLSYLREVAPSWTLGESSPPRNQIWLGARLGARRPIRDAASGDTAFVAGGGAMYLHVLKYDDAEFKSNCVFFGVGSETITGVGVGGWVDAQVGGDPEMGRTMATVALVYQEQSYPRANDCGD